MVSTKNVGGHQDGGSRVGLVEPLRVTCNGRRYFSAAHKRAVVQKCLVPGASLAAVALSCGFNANLVRKWYANTKSVVSRRSWSRWW